MTHENFKTFVVNDDSNFYLCKELVSNIFKNEIGHEQHGIIKKHQNIIACKSISDDKIVGCIVSESATETIKNNEISRLLFLTNIPKNLLHRFSVTDITAIEKKFRKSIVSYLLIARALKFLTDKHCYFSLASCEPSLYNYHKKIGFINLGAPYKSIYGGLQIPILLDLCQELNINKSTILKRIHREINYQGPDNSSEYHEIKKNILNFFPDFACNVESILKK